MLTVARAAVRMRSSLFAAPVRDAQALARVRERYELDLDPSTAPLLAERHGLHLG
jgi:hypothetical protein